MPRAKKAPSDKPGRRRLPILLRHAWYSLNQAFRRRLAATGITPDQYTTLRTLTENHPSLLTQSDLTRLIASDPNTVASLLERMEKAGWIARLPHEKDRRARRIQVLTAGAVKYKQGRQIALALQGEVFSDWPEDKRQAFLTDLERIAERCRTAASTGKRKSKTSKRPATGKLQVSSKGR